MKYNPSLEESVSFQARVLGKTEEQETLPEYIFRYRGGFGNDCVICCWKCTFDMLYLTVDEERVPRWCILHRKELLLFPGYLSRVTHALRGYFFGSIVDTGLVYENDSSFSYGTKVICLISVSLQYICKYKFCHGVWNLTCMQAELNVAWPSPYQGCWAISLLLGLSHLSTLCSTWSIKCAFASLTCTSLKW